MDRGSIVTAVVVVSIAFAAMYAATRQSEPAGTTSSPAVPFSAAPSSSLPPGHPPVKSKLPPGHPAIGSISAVPSLMLPPSAAAPSIDWVVPKRWVVYPNTSALRIATYRLPKSYGDIEDPEMSVMRAGGDVEANAGRWIAQFDEPSRASAKRTTKTVGGLEVHLVEVQGTFTNMDGDPEQNWELLGAIVKTPITAHFFKLTGPKKSVEDARGEFDALVDSIKPKPTAAPSVSAK